VNAARAPTALPNLERGRALHMDSISNGGVHRAPAVSIVMPTHARAALLPVVLGPLLADPGTAEIVVVVDGREDDSMDLLERMARHDDRVRPLAIERSRGARARLAGVRHARCDVVLHLDDDVCARPGLVAGHAAHHVGRTGLVVVGYMPVALPPRRGPGEFAHHVYAREYERHCARWEAEPGSVLTSLWGGNVSLRREDFLRATGDGHDLVATRHEDLDFGLRCRAAGLEGVFDRSLEAVHLYTRDAADFTAAARMSGAALVDLHRRHARQLGPLPADVPTRMLPRVAAPLVRAGGRWRALEALVRAGTRVAGRLHLFRLESAGGHLLWGIGQAVGIGRATSIPPNPPRRPRLRRVRREATTGIEPV
jgi:GT2 family glycosyltransferase